MLTLKAPAKLNLTLEVIGKREDGFHKIRSILQTVNLYDTLTFKVAEEIKITSDNPDWIPRQSLVSTTTALLREVTGCTRGAKIEVNKYIPLLSGLGGDSSNAAAVLRGLNEIWELELPLTTLLDLAARLGSDVSFFLYGGTALAEGKGEKITPLPGFPHTWIILMMPPLPSEQNKTTRLYAGLKARSYTEGKITDAMIALLFAGGEITDAYLYNVFDGVARDNFAGIDEYWRQFLKAGARTVHLSGSGPTLFALAEDKNQAEEIYLNLWQKGLESYLVEILPAIEKL
ncbi:4-(cytidine 5'-diphospho)-2-C-methyl-D-erythritol kinase [Chloroflexota bacterium]